MGLDATVRSAVKIIDKVTKSLQTTVTHYAWQGQNLFGAATLASGVVRNALFEPMHKKVKQLDGSVILIKARVLILEPIPPNGFAGRIEPVDPRDKIVGPDGFTGPIVGNPSLTDPSTTRPYFAQIFLGE